MTLQNRYQRRGGGMILAKMTTKTALPIVNVFHRLPPPCFESAIPEPVARTGGHRLQFNLDRPISLVNRDHTGPLRPYGTLPAAISYLFLRIGRQEKP